MRSKLESDRQSMEAGLAERHAEVVRQRDEVTRLRREEEAKAHAIRVRLDAQVRDVGA